MTPASPLGSLQRGAAGACNTGPCVVDGAPGALPDSDHSRLAQRLRRRYASELSLLPAGTPDRAGMAATYAQLQSRGHDTGVALRILRQLVMERLITLDCDQHAPLSA